MERQTLEQTGGIGRRALVALLVAIGWSVAVWVGAFTVPVYTGGTVSSESADVVESSDTLVGVNGMGAVAVVSIPLVLALLVGLCLTVFPWPSGRITAWVLTGLFGLFNLLSMLTIGLFLLPVTLALVVACATCQRGQPARAS